jgi:hypothetical protein
MPKPPSENAGMLISPDERGYHKTGRLGPSEGSPIDYKKELDD